MPASWSSFYPWIRFPLVVCAPMRLITLAPLAVAVSKAGGIGFLAAGTDVRDLKAELQRAAELFKVSLSEGANPPVLPIGVGFINWGAELDTALAAFKDYLPAAVWFFAPVKNEDLRVWTDEIRKLSKGKTKVWVQVGTVKDALHIAEICRPDVFVVQGTDAGGHGLAEGAGIISLLPEVSDALREKGFGSISIIAAGGIVEGRGAAACFALGAEGVVLGTRFLASEEANIPKGHQEDITRTIDGGENTVRTSVYDTLRGTTGWPERYNGRGIKNHSFLDAEKGMTVTENRLLYEEALRKGDQGWGPKGRLTAYAGSSIGLVKEIKSARDIVDEVRRDAVTILSKPPMSSSKL